MRLPPTSLPLPPQSDQHGRTQAANKTGIKRVSTHQAAAGKVREHAQSCLAPFHKLLFIILLGCSFLPSSTLFHFAPMFVCSLRLYLSEPPPGKLFTQWGYPEIAHFVGGQFSPLPPGHQTPFTLGILRFLFFLIR